MASFFICGDIVNKFSDNQFIDKELIDLIDRTDYAICNLEGVISSSKSLYSQGVFQKPSTLKNLKSAGFDMLLLANNHITDNGEEGLNDIICESRKYSFDHIGAGFSFEEVYRAEIITIGNEKFGLINICEAQIGHFDDEKLKFGYAWLGHNYVSELIVKTKNQVDYLLVFVHAGLEHYNLPLIEFRKLYRRFCDLGADSVICSHPHVAQGIEEYNNKLIFYSLGNFYYPRTPFADSCDIENHSFSIILDFIDKKIKYTPIFHSIDNLRVNLISSEDSLINLNLLNSNLLDPMYTTLIQTVYQQSYKNLIRNFYIEALMGTESNDSIYTTFKFFIKYAFFRKKYWQKTETYRNKLHLRLIQNETYLYLTRYVLLKKIQSDTRI